jgi:hypothetical protein
MPFGRFKNTGRIACRVYRAVDKVTAVTDEHPFDSGDEEPDRADEIAGSTSGLHALMSAYIDETLARRLDDLARCIRVHADLSGDDHLGHIGARAEATDAWDARMAEQRAAAGPERVRQAQRWARRVLRRAQKFQAGRPRRASAADFARALCAAVRKAEEYERAGMPVPAAADLVAAVADPVILRPDPNLRQGKIGIITIPTSDDELAKYGDDPDPESEPEVRPAGPAPLSVATRQAAAEHVLALVASTVAQIDRILDLAGLIHPDPDQQALTTPISSADFPADTALAIAVEVELLRSADYTRRHEDVLRAFTAFTAAGHNSGVTMPDTPSTVPPEERERQAAGQMDIEVGHLRLNPKVADWVTKYMHRYVDNGWGYPEAIADLLAVAHHREATRQETPADRRAKMSAIAEAMAARTPEEIRAEEEFYTRLHLALGMAEVAGALKAATQLGM